MKLSIPRIVAASAAILCVVSSSAHATNVRQAFALCDKDPKCKPTTNGNGSVTFTNGSYIIDCPQEGPCVCTLCRATTKVSKKPKRPATVTDFAK